MLVGEAIHDLPVLVVEMLGIHAVLAKQNSFGDIRIAILYVILIVVDESLCMPRHRSQLPRGKAFLGFLYLLSLLAR